MHMIINRENINNARDPTCQVFNHVWFYTIKTKANPIRSILQKILAKTRIYLFTGTLPMPIDWFHHICHLVPEASSVSILYVEERRKKKRGRARWCPFADGFGRFWVAKPSIFFWFFLRCGSFFGFVDFISLIVFYDFNGRIFWNVDFAFWLSDWLHVVLDLWFVVLSEYYIFWVHVFFLF